MLASAGAAAGLLAGPAAAGSGGSYTVPLIGSGSAPTIDGAVGTIEWSGATSIPATFAGRPATAYVARTATDLYFALAVNSPGQAAPGSSAFYFDNNDNGVTEVGDDIKFINSGGTPQDFHAIDANFSSVPDASNDTLAAQSYAGGVDMFEYKTALCSGDANDFCFLPPTTATSSKLGFTIAYGPASGGASLSPAGILDPAGYAEFVISPDTTPPPAPGLSVTETTSAFYNSATSVLWYRGATTGSFTLQASGTDPESGIDHANLPAVPFSWDTGASTPTSLTYFFPDSTVDPAPPGLFGATLVNGAGLEGPPTQFSFNTDSTRPTGGIDCVPVSCSSANAPVTVTISATDNGGSGIKRLHYTTNGADPGPDSGTVIAPGGSFVVTSPNRTVKVWGIDNVGNAGQLASASVSGSPFCGVLGNCGFENALPDPQNNNCDPAVTARVTFGNWLPFYNCNNPTAPSLIDGPQHSGINSGQVVSSTWPSGGNGAFFLQDVPNPSFDPNQGFELTTWVNLAEGYTQGLLLFDWDRGIGNTVGTAGFTVSESSISFGAWGKSTSFEPGISLNGWHELKLHADAGTLTSTLSLDGEQVGSITTTGSAYKLSRSFPNPHTALLLGDACGTCTAPNRAYFDDTSLVQLVPPDPPQAGPTFTVNTDADHADAAGCTQSDCTLREAIDAANSHEGPDTVAFAIPGEGLHTISLATPLPPLMDNGTTIDGFTQAGSSQNTLATGDNAVLTIRLDGAVVVGGPDPAALELDGAVNTIQGLSIGTTLGTGFNKAIRITGIGATGNVIRGNHIGPGNAIDGIDIRASATGNRVGGPEPADRNVLTGNGDAGVSISSSGRGAGPATSGNRIEGNLVSANRQGVIVQDGAVRTVVTGNEITGNSANGVALASGLDGETLYTGMQRNSIYGNGALGIDLGMDGVTQNDTGDIDTGPNQLQNFPILGVPIVKGASLTIAARLTSLPSTSYVIDAYGNPTCDESGYGEGKTYLGSTNVSTDRLGVATVSLAFEIGAAPGGVTLTATEAKNHETSEFSQCRAPQVAGTTTDSTVSLSSNTGSSEAGASIVTLAGLPRSAFGPPPAPIESSPIESSPIESSPIESSPIESSPIESSPIESSPIESSPIESSPIESSPIESSGFTGGPTGNLQRNGLGGVPLADLPLLHGKTWAGLLGRDLPEQSTTLADALAISPRPAGLSALKVGDIDWAHSNSPLASLGVGAFAVGPAKLANLPLPGNPLLTPLQRWCKQIGDLQGFSCDPAVPGDVARLQPKTVMDIALEGVPIESSGLGTVPIESSNLAGTPIESSPIESSNLVGTPIESSALSAIDLSVSPFGNIPLAAVLAPALASPLRNLPLSAVPSGVLTCVGAACGTKLGDATVAAGAKVRDLGAALNTFTVGDLKTYPGVTFGNIGRGLPADINLRDLLRALFATVPFDPETLPLEGIQTVADAGGLVRYTATLTLHGGGAGNAFAQLRAAIPDGARYKPGTTVFSAGGDTLATNDPGVMSTGQLGWSLNGLAYETAYTLAFQVYPGLQLGTDTTSVTLLPVGLPAKSATPVNVAVTDTFEGGGGNDTPATATPVQPGKLYLSFEQTQADTDWYSLPVPPVGSVTTFKLSHLTKDRDIVVYAPADAPLRSAPIESSPIESSPIESSTVLDPAPTLQHGTDQLQPAAVQDIPIESSQLTSRVVAGVSDNPGTATDAVTVVSTGAPAGSTYLVHVVATDPEPTTSPYVLHVDQEAPATPAVCPLQRTFPFPGGGTAGTLPAFGTVPAATKTMILVDYKRYGDTFGTAALTTLRTKLAAFAARSDIAGVVLPVEGSVAVQNAYNTWDTGRRPCSPEFANAVVRAIISNVVDPFRAGHPNVKFLVLVGGDDIIPFPRVPDNTTTANESSYVGTIGYPNAVPTNNQLVGTAASSYMQTDDVWSAFNPTPLLNTPLYLPQWATGRLVETSGQIERAIDAYGTGTINPTTQLTAGYGFLTDSSNAVALSLKTFAPGGPGDLINNAWTHGQLLTQLQRGNAASPQIVSINAHYDHHRALPGNGDTTDLFDSRDIFNPADPTVPVNSELARIIFSVGCHSGYSVPNVLYTAPFSLDWPEADFAAGAVVRVANTTYGYGDTEVIGYSESVEAAFASRLNQMTLGEALLYAKQQYIADLATIGPFEQKSVNALTFYGLPMQQIGTPGGPGAPPPPPATTTDPITGLQTLAVTSLVPTFTEKTAADGSRYFTGPSGVDATNGRPFEPKRIVPDITQPGTMPHDFLLTGLDLETPHLHYPAARSRAIPDSAGLTPPLSSQVGWPSSLSRIGSFASPTGPRQQLVLIHGQFLSDDSDTNGTGTQTNFTRISGNVLYSPSKDAIPPQLSKIRVTSVGTTAAFELDATDAISTSDSPPSGTVKAVVVVYYEPGASTSKTILLSQTPGTNHWSGGGPLSGSSVQEINYVIQAVDLAGNVGLSVHKVVAAPVVLRPPTHGNLDISPAGTSVGGGWFSGDVTVTIAPDPGYTVSYSVDGTPLKPYTGPFVVSGDGVHLVDAVAENPAGDEVHASKAIGIDSQAAAISILSPVDAQYALVGAGPKALYSCSDSGIGLAATNGCVGTVPVGSPVDAATPGTKTFTVTARDALGRTTSKSVSYRVWRTPGDAIVALADKTLLYLKQAPLGIVLKGYLTLAANELVAKHQPAACAALNLYVAAVKITPTNVLTTTMKADLIADATRIKVLIGCAT